MKKLKLYQVILTILALVTISNPIAISALSTSKLFEKLTDLMETNVDTSDLNVKDYYDYDRLTLLAEKIEQSEEHLIEFGNIKSSSFSPSNVNGKSLNIPRFPQQNNYYCGPATVAILIQYITGVVVPQSTLANSSNLQTDANGQTYVYLVPIVLNKYTNSGYVYAYTSQKNVFAATTYDIDNNFPLIYNVDAHYINGNYPVGSGHYIVGYGYAWGIGAGGGYFEQISYFDTFNGLYGTYGNFHVPSQTMINAINMNNALFIW